jgi:hypothetical protein
LWENYFLRYDRSLPRDQIHAATLVGLGMSQIKKKYEALRAAVIAAGYDIDVLDDPNILSGEALVMRYGGIDTMEALAPAKTSERVRESALGDARDSDSDDDDVGRSERQSALNVRKHGHSSSVSASGSRGGKEENSQVGTEENE